MEAIRLFLEIFIIREFSHWPEELVFFLFIILVSYVAVEFKHGQLKWYTFYFCITYRCVSPAIGLCLHSCLMCGIGKVCVGFKCMANNILCRGAQGHFLKFRHGDEWESIFLSYKNFPRPHQLANQLFLYDKPEKKWAHTHPTPEKATAP